MSYERNQAQKWTMATEEWNNASFLNDAKVGSNTYARIGLSLLMDPAVLGPTGNEPRSDVVMWATDGLVRAQVARPLH
jgi:hypothetical protein